MEDMNKWQELTISNTKAIEGLIVVNRENQKDLKAIIDMMDKNNIHFIDNKIRNIEESLKILAPVLTICKYPKISLFVLVSALAFFIKDIRHPLLSFLGF